MSDKYNERVRALATQMAKEAHNHHRMVGRDYWPGLAESTKSRKINSFISAARIAVKHMAIWYQKGCFDMKTVHQSPAELKALRAVIDNNKIQQGLIPDSAQEGEQTVSPAMEVPVFTDMPTEAKEKAITTAAEGAGMMLLSAFMMCGLQTHIETTIYNEPTREYFRLSFTKQTQPEGGQNDKAD